MNASTLGKNKSLHLIDLPFSNTKERIITIGICSTGDLFKGLIGEGKNWFSITLLADKDFIFSDGDELNFDFVF